MTQEVFINYDGQDVSVQVDVGAISVFSGDSAQSVIEAAQQAEQDASAALAATLNKLDKTGVGATAGFANTVGAAVKGLSNAVFTQTVPNAVARPYYQKARESLSVEDFQGISSDDQAVVEYALAAAADAGGLLELVGFEARVIEENLIVPAQVKWRGPLFSPDTPLQDFNFSDTIGKIVLKPGASIQLGNEVTLSDWRIIRDGITAPYANLAAARAGIAAFAGTAITNASTGNTLERLQILGFDKAFLSTVGQRLALRSLKIDCTNGIEIQNSADVCWTEDVSCWPFLTANQGFEDPGNLPSFDVLARSGTAFKWDGVAGAAINDWPNGRDLFAYGYQVGYWVAGADHSSLVNCAADNVSQLWLAGGASRTRAEGTIGFYVGANSRNTVLDCPRAAAQGRSFVVESNGDSPRVAINSPRSWAPMLRHLHAVTGSVVLNDSGGLESQTAGEIAAGYPNGNVILLDDTITSAEITLRGESKPSIAGSAAALAKTTFNNQAVTTVASAGTVTIQPYWNRINLTGTTNIGAILPTFPGHVIYVSTTSPLQVLVGGNLLLEGAVRRAMKSGDVLQLVCDGTNWREPGVSNSTPYLTTTPTPVPQTGTFTSASATVTTRLEGDMCDFYATITVTTLGTATGAVSITLPYTSNGATTFGASEPVLNGFGGYGFLPTNSTTVTLRRADGGTFLASGAVIALSGRYRVQA